MQRPDGQTAIRTTRRNTAHETRPDGDVSIGEQMLSETSSIRQRAAMPRPRRHELAKCCRVAGDGGGQVVVLLRLPDPPPPFETKRVYWGIWETSCWHSEKEQEHLLGEEGKETPEMQERQHGPPGGLRASPCPLEPDLY
ncbi:hypothetical protein EYF80_050538 [Liparis tanakae]|uniref:Uncharacterized protein n=1 Tax=Liparis tanakae TaxID=230148 RepID=A0A4Z2FDT0_9TELE|nr:hypothetical protein EYF80_050538 [Liparis tanakae]